MSKRIRFPNGYIGTVSDKVAEILATRPGHAIIRDRPGALGEAASKTLNENQGVKNE
jgi:hypothetical protein